MEIGNSKISMSVSFLIFFILIPSHTTAFLNLSLSSQFSECTFHLSYFNLMDLASNLIYQNYMNTTAWTISSTDNNVTNKFKYLKERCDINLILNPNINQLLINSTLLRSVRADSPRSIFLLFWMWPNNQIYMNPRIKYRSAQFYVFHVTRTKVMGLGVCPFKQDMPNLELEEIPRAHGLLHHSMQRRIHNCKKNLNMHPVRVIHIEYLLKYNLGVHNTTCDHSKRNYFSQPRCNWDRWHYVLQILSTEFNFTKVSIDDKRLTYSFIQTPFFFDTPFNEQLNDNYLAVAELQLSMLYREPAEDVVRRSMSFGFWFKPFDFPSWMLILR